MRAGRRREGQAGFNNQKNSLVQCRLAQSKIGARPQPYVSYGVAVGAIKTGRMPLLGISK